LEVHPQGTIHPAVSPETTTVTGASGNPAGGRGAPPERDRSVLVHNHHAPIPAPIAVAATDSTIFVLSAGDFAGRREGFTG
jgi:hypothetical protein